MSMKARKDEAHRENAGKFSGSLDVANIHEFARTIPAKILEGLRNHEDPTGPVADALDDLGVRGCVPASLLSPTIPGSQVVGPALTLRRIPSRYDPYSAALSKTPRMAAMDVHYRAKPGDVLVIQDAGGGSSGGGNSALIGQHYGELGAVIDGAIRDVGQSRRIGYPIWAREITPMTGKWRSHAMEINGVVTIAGIQVAPGDLVVADDSGICFVPAELVEKVWAWCEEHFRPTNDLRSRSRAELAALRKEAEAAELARRSEKTQ
jgi:4-hydroxy-4-methyl-2-oxoglutarate aldolase